MRVGPDRQVRTPPRLVQIGARRAPAPLAVGRALEGAGAFLLAIVEIVVARQPGLDPRGNKGIGQFPADRLGHDPRRPARAGGYGRAPAPQPAEPAPVTMKSKVPTSILPPAAAAPFAFIARSPSRRANLA